jgi:hypothetical protein
MLRMRTLLGLAAATAALLAPAAASAETRYRDNDAGVQVRLVSGGRVVIVAFSHPDCGRGFVRARVRRSGFARTAPMSCGDPLGLRQIRVRGTVGRDTVRGTVAGRPFRAERGAGPATPAQRCGHLGQTLAETDIVRVYRDGDRTVACRLSDGSAVRIGYRQPDEQDYYASGISAAYVQAIGSRIAYSEAPFNTAASKYGAGDEPMFRPTIVIRDLVTGAQVRQSPEVVSLRSLVLRADGRFAWTGADSSYYSGDIYVKTVQDGKVVTLDKGADIIATSLRAEGDGFAWSRG